jgi:hypothetical protein
LAWLYMTGELPNALVDHVDTCRSNDAWENLRLATYRENAQNANAHKDNQTGFRGVSWHKRRGMFQAELHFNGKRKHLGYFGSAEEAAHARDTAAAEHHGAFARFTVLSR